MKKWFARQLIEWATWLRLRTLNMQLWAWEMDPTLRPNHLQKPPEPPEYDPYVAAAMNRYDGEALDDRYEPYSEP